MYWMSLPKELKKSTAFAKVLVVDDEEANVEIIAEHLEGAEFEILRAYSGSQAWESLRLNPEIDAVLLDRMMPDLSGLDLLKRIRHDPKLKGIPVILQSALVAPDEVMEGMDHGAYYYLTKPFQKETLLALTKSAIEDRQLRKLLCESLSEDGSAFCLLRLGKFEFKSVDEARVLAFFVAQYHDAPEEVIDAIAALLTNAVEHGNLGVGYEVKKAAMLRGDLDREINRRLSLVEHSRAYASLLIKAEEGVMTVQIKDHGKGFDWQPYLEMSVDRAADPNGRGIARAVRCLDQLTYVGSGNELVCRFPLAEKLQPLKDDLYCEISKN